MNDPVDLFKTNGTSPPPRRRHTSEWRLLLFSFAIGAVARLAVAFARHLQQRIPSPLAEVLPLALVGAAALGIVIHAHRRERRAGDLDYAQQRDRGREAAIARAERLRREADEARRRVAQTRQREGRV